MIQMTRKQGLTQSLVLSCVLQVDQEMLFEIILAANYLDIKPLL
jgi:hypothetical protein